ncbi:hypothetical protein C8J56DRAFT_1026424 [Mycena floridula]|nr:hypothetical protein C8J56DRAFT_1026424 [Mycena floridula]
MPPFSLVRHFGKQCKATIDSSVSSSLVTQHVSHTMGSSYDLSAGPVALSQCLKGLVVRNINAPIMSNNNVNINNNINNYYGSQANFEDGDAIRAGDIYLEEEIERYLDENSVWRTRYKGQIMASSTRNISIWSYRGERAMEEFERAYQVYASLPRHPNILQLYGICRSLHLTALVFHGTPHLLYRWEYYKVLPSSQWIPHYIKLHKQYEPEQSAHSMLEAHNLRGTISVEF